MKKLKISVFAIISLTVGFFGKQASAQQMAYVELPAREQVYQAGDHVGIDEGSVSCWLKLLPGISRRDHVIFHTDDSRIVLYLDTYFSSSRKQDIVRIAARAGGTHRAVDSASASGNFPEASIIIDNDGILSDYGSTTPWYSSVPFPEGEWHLVGMIWSGYPDGVVRIFFDGKVIGEKPYDRRYNDDRPIFSTFAIGMRPGDWTGEIIQIGDGEMVEGKPRTSMSMTAGGLEISHLRVYRQVIPDWEWDKLLAKFPEKSLPAGTTIPEYETESYLE